MEISSILQKAIEDFYKTPFQWRDFLIEELDYEWAVTPIRFINNIHKFHHNVGVPKETLIVPKNGKNVLFLPFGHSYSKKTGVNYLYDIELSNINCDKVKLAKFIGVYLFESPIPILEAILSKKNLGVYDIYEPLIFKNEIEAMGITIRLYRPNEMGGYF